MWRHHQVPWARPCYCLVRLLQLLYFSTLNQPNPRHTTNHLPKSKPYRDNADQTWFQTQENPKANRNSKLPTRKTKEWRFPTRKHCKPRKLREQKTSKSEKKRKRGKSHTRANQRIVQRKNQWSNSQNKIKRRKSNKRSKIKRRKQQKRKLVRVKAKPNGQKSKATQKKRNDQGTNGKSVSTTRKPAKPTELRAFTRANYSQLRQTALDYGHARKATREHTAARRNGAARRTNRTPRTKQPSKTNGRWLVTQKNNSKYWRRPTACYCSIPKLD